MRLLTLARDLTRRKGRERQQKFVAEGVRAVEALLQSTLSVQGLLVSPSGLDNERVSDLSIIAEQRGIPLVQVSNEELLSASDTDSPQGVLAVAEIPHYEFPTTLTEPVRLLILDALQDPGNVGTVIRTAAALGVSATIALPGTADPWNAKVVRASMGALFHHPVLSASWDGCKAMLSSARVALYAADAKGQSISELSTFAPRIALVVSNEGAGLSPEIRAEVEMCVSIPMSPSIESLNVGVATGILLHAIRVGQGSSTAWR